MGYYPNIFSKFSNQTVMKYCESIYSTKRFKTRQVMVGNIGVGGDNPIRIQSMTNSNTRDVEATIDQVMKLSDAGCEIVRVTVQGMKEAEACEKIKEGLIKHGYSTPLVADIHFYPPAALRVIDFVDKVRINPGNFADRRATFQVLEHSEETYAKEIEKIEQKFIPLVQKCKSLKKALRIGTNHGSLSDRIMNRYGDTPQGMVESALEFARICRSHDYHDLIFSMKASNPQVMVQAYRLLAARMIDLGWDYPLHLGVTEAGEGEDGRIKSAMGIGSLLLDGLGDTIRVSLTEDPWHEMDPCKRLVNFANEYQNQGVSPFQETYRSVENTPRREVILPKHLSMHRDGTVVLSASKEAVLNPLFAQHAGCEIKNGQIKLTRTSADSLVTTENFHHEVLDKLKEAGVGVLNPIPLSQAVTDDKARRFSVNIGSNSYAPEAVFIDENTEPLWDSLLTIKPSIFILRPKQNRLHFSRKFFEWLQSHQLNTPVILNFRYQCTKEDLVIQASAECGSLFCDGLGDGIWLEGPYEMDFLRNLSFNILQSARMRTIKTDFISCPSCGRTLFDLQETTQRIRTRTAHLPGVKIAIMGCIVNGPGEMADADFGYVGSRPGKIDLYVGKECVEKNIDFADADDRLVALIKAHDRWIEPVS